MCRIVSDPTNRAWIQWSRQGNRFRVCDWKRLVAELNRYGLRGSRRPSVVKNLRDYGFLALQDSRRRIADANGRVWDAYKHKHFKRDSHELLRCMRRRRPRDRAQSPEGDPDSSSESGWDTS
ncbi:hypothetical protein H4R19_003714 [Coemansia spiralis]|nr:hypothetical protein H4R19_003714 [Coemansia spiralis]